MTTDLIGLGSRPYPELDWRFPAGSIYQEVPTIVRIKISEKYTRVAYTNVERWMTSSLSYSNPLAAIQSQYHKELSQYLQATPRWDGKSAAPLAHWWSR